MKNQEWKYSPFPETWKTRAIAAIVQTEEIAEKQAAEKSAEKYRESIKQFRDGLIKRGVEPAAEIDYTSKVFQDARQGTDTLFIEIDDVVFAMTPPTYRASDYRYKFHLVQYCEKCKYPILSFDFDGVDGLGKQLREFQGRGHICPDPEDESGEGKKPAPAPEPTTAEKLEELVRDIVRDEIQYAFDNR